MKLETLLATCGHFLDEATGAVVPPLHTSTTFARDREYELRDEFIYGRYGNPTSRVLEELLGKLDEGEEALSFSSGLTAATAIIETLPPDAGLLAPTVMYHGAQDWFRRAAERREIRLSFFDASDLQSLGQRLQSGDVHTVWLESPVNPTWDVIDIRAAAELTRGAGATLVVDSTVAPPVTTKPLALGADWVLHSSTKYLNGHSDVLGGVVVTKQVDARWEHLRQVRKLTGGIMAPFEAWLLMRGMRTLAVRFERASETALELATHFEGHPAIERCLYPGLPSHPGHAIAAQQMTNGFGGMLSLLIRGDGDQARTMAADLRVVRAATSLGGVESHIEHRASVEGPHSKVPPNLIRLSIGLEAVTDLMDDLDRVLTALA